jgi:hypothetical protein
MSPPKLADVILDLCKQAGPRETIDPIDAAKAFAAVSERTTPYQGFLQTVRDTVVLLAKDGKLVIYRKGEPVDPDTFRGVYRFGLPNSG